MTVQLLPVDFDEQVRDAVRIFWATRASRVSTQGGARGNVIAGKNLDGFLAVVRSVAVHSGVPDSAVFTRGRSDLTLPGYYRPTKNWDVVVVHQQRLLAVLEFKSQVGSFGNNFNNRAEEAIGSASDLWAAARHCSYLPANHTAEQQVRTSGDPRPPFLGYLMFLEDCDESTRSVGTTSPHYRVFSEFEGTSYAERYRILCERMVQEKLYQAAALMLSAQDAAGLSGQYRSDEGATSVRNLFAEFAAQLLAATQS